MEKNNIAHLENFRDLSMIYCKYLFHVSGYGEL